MTGATPDTAAARTPIFLFGAGGQGRSVFEVIERHGVYEVVTVLDDRLAPDTEFRGLPILGGRECFGPLFEGGPRRGFIAVGNNFDRENLTSLALEAGLSLVTVVDPAAHIARGVTVGAGTVVMPGVVVSAGAVIGEHAILNTSCSVDHDTIVGAYAHLSPGVHVSGGCEIGAQSHIGIGASVVQRVRVGQRARVGAGAAVIDDVLDDSIVVGVPARPIESKVRAEGVG